MARRRLLHKGADITVQKVSVCLPSAFAQLGKAIQSGDVDAAKSAYASMLKSRGERPPVETAKPIAVDTASSGGAGSLVNLTA